MFFISADLRIRATIKEGAIYYFIEESFTRSNDPHYFVILNKKPLEDEALILVNATTKIEERKQMQKNMPPETLIEVSPTECCELTRDSIFDCNSVTEKSLDSLIAKLEENKLGICREIMPTEILEKLRNGVIKSPVVNRSHKKLIQ